MSAFSAHLSFETLADLAEGRLPAEAHTRAQAHLAGCARCAEELAAWQDMIRLMRADDSRDAPAAVIARAQRLFRPRPQPEAPRRQRLIATLTFDSAQRPWALGVRSGPSALRQMLFTAGEHDVEVRVQRTGDAWQISGQVLGPGVDGVVELRGPRAANRFLNALGEFTLAPVPPGEYALSFHLAQAEIAIPALTLGD